MENALPVAPTRLGGPAYVTGELQSDYPGLLEGRLRFILRDAGTVFSVVETDPVALVAGVTPFRQIIPIPSSSTGYGFPEAAVEFVGDHGRYNLGTIPIRLPSPGMWEAIVLVAEPKERLSAADAGLFRDALNLERAFGTDSQSGSNDVDCFLPTLPARQFPEQPLAYCAFDLVGLPAESFQRMNSRQLDAIAAWTRAGGATCVAVDGALDAKHADFLNALFRDSGGGPFLRDDTGQIVEPEGTADGLYGRPAGLGFAAVLFGPLDQFDFDSSAWREAHARLWHLRDEHVRQRRTGGAVTPAPGSANSPIIEYINGQQVQYQTQANLFTVPTPSYGTAVINALRPSEIRLLPGWAVALLLFGYVAVVGPLDYFLLGRLRLRKWTWVTFPVVTFAVAWGVVATADAFMSDNDHRRTVEVVDFDAAGVPVRRTRLELLFRGSGAPVVHEITKGWFSAVDRQHFDMEENAAPTGPYAGTLPSRYVVPQQVAKWTPQVNRTFEIAPEGIPAIDWAALEADGVAGPISMPGGATGFRLRLHGGKLSGAGTPLGSVSDDPLFAYRGNPNYPQMYPGYQQNVSATPFLEAATAGVATERSAVQYQRSPLGFGRLDDLPFVDASDPAADVLVVWAEERDGDVIVYRKHLLEHRPSGGEPPPDMSPTIP